MGQTRSVLVVLVASSRSLALGLPPPSPRSHSSVSVPCTPLTSSSAKPIVDVRVDADCMEICLDFAQGSPLRIRAQTESGFEIIPPIPLHSDPRQLFRDDIRRALIGRPFLSVEKEFSEDFAVLPHIKDFTVFRFIDAAGNLDSYPCICVNGFTSETTKASSASPCAGAMYPTVGLIVLVGLPGSGVEEAALQYTDSHRLFRDAFATRELLGCVEQGEDVVVCDPLLSSPRTLAKFIASLKGVPLYRMSTLHFVKDPLQCLAALRLAAPPGDFYRLAALVLRAASA